MIQKEVIILGGKKFRLAFNFATICKIEEMTGQPFDVSTLSETRKTSDFLTLIWAALSANNIDFLLFDDFARELSVEDYKVCNEYIAVLLSEFYKPLVPEEPAADGDEQHQDP